MHTSPPQSWLTASHVSTATAGMAGGWDYFKAEKSLPGCGREVTADGFHRQMMCFVKSLRLTNSSFQFAVPSDFSFARNLIYFPSSYYSHFLFTYLFTSLSARSWFKFGFQWEELLDVENWKKALVPNVFFLAHVCAGCVHVSRRVKVQGAAIHEAPAWCSLRSRSAVTSCLPQHRSLQACTDIVRHPAHVVINTTPSQPHLCVLSWGNCSSMLIIDDLTVLSGQ